MLFYLFSHLFVRFYILAEILINNYRLVFLQGDLFLVCVVSTHYSPVSSPSCHAIHRHRHTHIIHILLLLYISHTAGLKRVLFLIFFLRFSTISHLRYKLASLSSVFIPVFVCECENVFVVYLFAHFYLFGYECVK